jgi:hypothetical protein
MKSENTLLEIVMQQFTPLADRTMQNLMQRKSGVGM